MPFNFIVIKGPYDFAPLYAALGDKEKCLSLLREAREALAPEQPGQLDDHARHGDAQPGWEEDGEI